MTTSLRIALLASCIGLVACSDPAETAYKSCVAKVKDATAQADKNASDSKDPMGQAMAPAMKEMALTMGQAACDSIRQMCKQDPKGQDCQNAIATFK